MLTCMIDAMEGQDVATADISGAFLQTYHCKLYIHIKTDRDMVTLLEDICPAYYNNFIYLDSHGWKLIYAEAKNIIYCTLEA